MFSAYIAPGCYTTSTISIGAFSSPGQSQFEPDNEMFNIYSWFNVICNFGDIVYYSVRVRVFSATFNNISVISWQPVLLVEEAGVPRENHWPITSQWQTLSHNDVSSAPRLSGIRTNNVSCDRYWVHR